MKRIASAPFELTLKNGEKKQYKLGEQIAAEHVDHWWATAHSSEFDLEAEAARRAKQEAGAAELQRLKEENAHLLDVNQRGAVENARLQDENSQLRAQVANAQGQAAEIAKLRAQCDELRAELAAGTDQTKDGGKKKSDRDESKK